MNRVFEKIKNALHKEDLEFMQQADLMGCIDSIIDKVALDDKNGWIPVEKELPETGEMVLGLSNDGDIWLYNFRKWDSESGGFYRNIINQYAQSTLPDDSVIAWQPIPAPYQPKGEW